MIEKKVAATLHFDKKLMNERMDGVRSVKERLVISATGDRLEKSQLLGLPKLDGSSAMDQAEGIYAMVETCGLSTNCKTLCYDTTIVITGRLGGVVILLQHLLGHSLICLACRRHISKLLGKFAL